MHSYRVENANLDACLMGEGSYQSAGLKRQVMPRRAAFISMTGDYLAGLSVTACKTMDSRARCNGQTEQ